MFLKIDCWTNCGDNQSEVYAALTSLLSKYPILITPSEPTLGSARGRILLYNRITDDLTFGTPISWPQNSSGVALNITNPSVRNYRCFVQDQFKNYSYYYFHEIKLNFVTGSFYIKNKFPVLINFASATLFGVAKLLIMKDLLNYFGNLSLQDRPTQFGWIMFDYEFDEYQTNTYGGMTIVDLIIASNFGYEGYENTFQVT